MISEWERLNLRRLQERLNLARGPRLHEMSWEEYVGPDPEVVDDAAWGPVEFAYIEEAENNLIAAHARLRRGALVGIELPAPASGIRCIAYRDLVVMVSDDAQELYGGVFDGTTFVPERHRGKGYSKHLHLALDGHHRAFLEPTHFSLGGIAARRSAHREATERAFAAGREDIHPENLERYRDVLSSTSVHPDLPDSEPQEPAIFGI